jgi:hypothetical protein
MTNLPLQHGRIPKCIQAWMSGLRVDAVELPDISPEMSSDLMGLIEGNGREQTRGQRKRAGEERKSKVLFLFHTYTRYTLIDLSRSPDGGSGNLRRTM